MSTPYFRYRISRALYQWMLQTETDWYLKPTYEEAVALKNQLEKEWRRENGIPDDDQPLPLDGTDGAAVDPAHGGSVPGSRPKDENWDRDYS